MNHNDGFLVYTDGSCYTKDRIGAWAWVAVDGDGAEMLQGGWALDTTISQMELTAPTQALVWLYEQFGPSVVLVYSDSEYVTKGITDRTRARRKNIDLWDDLDLITDTHEVVEFEHVKGHAGTHYNELVDGHAGMLRKKAQELSSGNPPTRT